MSSSTISRSAIQPLLAVVIVVGVILVLVLRSVSDNFAAGVLTQSRQTVKIGDELQVEGPDGVVIGTVIELNSRAVRLRTLDGRTVHVLNAKILSDVIINDSTQGARRSEVQVRVECSGEQVDAVAEGLVEAAQSAEGVHTREHPRVLFTSLSDERATVRLQFWHHPLHGPVVTSEVVRAARAHLASGGWKGTVTSIRFSPPLVPPDAI